MTWSIVVFFLFFFFRASFGCLWNICLVIYYSRVCAGRGGGGGFPSLLFFSCRITFPFRSLVYRLVISRVGGGEGEFASLGRGGLCNPLGVIANLSREEAALLWLQVVFNYLLTWLVVIPAPLVSSNYSIGLCRRGISWGEPRQQSFPFRWSVCFPPAVPSHGPLLLCLGHRR